MPWKDTTIMEQKVEFINEWLSNQYTVTELCKAFEISRPTAYRLIKRYEEFGVDGLLEQSRSPINHPNKTCLSSPPRYRYAKERNDRLRPH